jgi:16S rRNA (guanine527-N7)-methyltransferase
VKIDVILCPTQTPGAFHESGAAVYNLPRMDPARIAELLQPFVEGPLSPRPIREWTKPSVFAKSFHSAEASSGEESALLTPALLQNISIYIDLLLRWNARINLTAVRDPEEMVTRHFGESLFAARHLFSDPRVPLPGAAPPQETASHPLGRSARDLIDLGSGAGFPGLPIKMWAPGIRATLIESNQKRATFLREAIRALRLTDINVFSGRGEDFAEQGRLVTLRAVERFDAVLPATANLVAASGRVALLVGGAQVERARQLLPTFVWQHPVSIPLSSNRVLLLGKRI